MGGFWSIDLMRIYEDLKEEEEDNKNVLMGMQIQRFWTFELLKINKIMH